MHTHLRQFSKSGFGTLFMLFFIKTASAVDAPDPVDTTYNTMEEVVVTATRNPVSKNKAAIKTEVITRSEIEASGKTNLSGLLSVQPGMHVSYANASGNSVSMQGLPSDYALVLVDGQRLIGRTKGALNLDRIPSETIERIEIVRGATSSLYGSEAMGGVINIITKRASDGITYDATLGYGELGQFLGSTGLYFGSDRLSNATQFAYRSRQQYSLPSETAPEMTGRSFEQYNVRNATTFDLMEELKAGLHVSAVRREEQGVNNYPTKTDSVKILEEKKESTIADGGISLEHKTDNNTFRIESTYSQYNDTYTKDYKDSADDKYNSVEDTREDYADLVTHWSFLPVESHRVSLGLENIWERIESDRVPSGPVNRQRNAVYVQDEWDILQNPGIQFTPGLRLDYDETYRENLSPRAGLRFDPLSSLTLWTAYGWGFRAPSLKELYQDFEFSKRTIKGNDELKPESSKSITADAEYRIGSLVFSTGIFFHEIKEKINTVVIVGNPKKPPSTSRYTNVDAVESKGFETGFRVNPIHSFSLRVNYVYTDAIDVKANRPLDGQANHAGTVHASYKILPIGLTASVTAAFVDRRPYYNATKKETEYKDSYNDISVKLEQKIGKNLRAFVIGENLTNEYNETNLVRPPRNFWGGLTYASF